MLRLAVRVHLEDAELVLAELLELAPSGVEEVALPEGVVEYAVYGAPGELPALPDVQAAAGCAPVLALDNDPATLVATRTNARANGGGDRSSAPRFAHQPDSGGADDRRQPARPAADRLGGAARSSS